MYIFDGNYIVYNPSDNRSQKYTVYSISIDFTSDADNINEICQLKHKCILLGLDQFESLGISKTNINL